MTAQATLEQDAEPNFAVRIVESPWFSNFILTVIIINAVTLGLETRSDVMSVAGGLIQSLDKIAIAIFTGEIALKLFAYRQRFFRDGWNIFDLVIVVSAYLPAGAGFSVLRALRILRALRLISIVPSMRRVVQGLLSAIPSMGSVVVLLLLIFYIAAVMATKLFGAAFPQWFGTIGESFYSLFQIMTLESWSMGIVRPVMEVYPYAWVFFVPFVLLSSFIVLNLFIAIIVSSMQEAEGQASHQEREDILHEIQALRGQIDALQDSLKRK
ncbi:ion transporter [Sphingorhabdus arenilitoris]|uniref:Ion transporter n=1 Tax=Sphingorhabdus arenilitoris TaxID=1490041 RepID=A0ABV8RC72_9SPHN